MNRLSLYTVTITHSIPAVNEYSHKSITTSATIVGGLALVMLIVFLGFLSAYFQKKTALLGTPDNIRDSFTVNGHGEAIGIPDIALLSAGLETTGKDIALAQKENTEKMNGFIEKTKAFGIADKDVKTTNYSVNPRYEWRNNGQQMIGYTVSNTVELKVRDTKKTSDVIGLIGQFGLNQVGGFSFTVDNPSELKSAALDKALADAREKAERVAKSGGTRLGRLISFWENTGSVPPGPIPYGMGGDVRMLEAAKAPVIASGSNTVTVDINATYEILP